MTTYRLGLLLFIAALAALAVIAIDNAQGAITASSSSGKWAVVRLNKTFDHVDNLKIVGTSTARRARLKLTIDCGGDLPGFEENFFFRRRKTVVIDQNHLAVEWETLRAGVCKVHVEVRALGPGRITARIIPDFESPR